MGYLSNSNRHADLLFELIDRLVHHAEIIALKGESYRHKEARERAEQRSRKRKATAGSSP